jgi:DMSO/TMAO reductase YedYZ molybdopterin-dependent catalytic subunit
MANWSKIIEGKIRIAKQGARPSKPSGNDRVPPGQKVVTDFPVLDLGNLPDLDQHNWRLRLFGLVEREATLDWEAMRALPPVRAVSDFHCVTRWSQLDMDWEGVLARDVITVARPLAEARFVTLHGADGYTTNLPLAALLDDDVLVAHSVFGRPLAAEHGGPVRLVVPKRYGWKSAKWLTGLELHADDRPGFWEVRGYHNEADPWKEQRFDSDA